METALKQNNLLKPEWRVATGLVAYPDAVDAMEQRVAAIESVVEPELLWLLEHPSLYTAGTSATEDELVEPGAFPVFETGRGGRYTYHGPGQRVIYALCDLRKRDRDVRQHVWRLEEWIIRVLKNLDVIAERREGRIGIWVDHNGRDKKIAAIGVRVRRWITYHGLALNVQPELAHFNGIVPCGLSEFGVTSLHVLGVQTTMTEIDALFRKEAAGLIF